MKKNFFVLTVGLVLLVAMFSYAEQSLAPAQALKSTIEDQKNIEVTVYNNNLGLVKDMRFLRLPQGEGELRFMDVAAAIIPETVHIKSLNFPKDFSVLEQNYEYDLMNGNKLLDKYVGKDIKLLDFNPYQDRKTETPAKLLSNNGDQIYQINNEIYLGHPGYRILPELPENLIAQPTLTWNFRNKAIEPNNIEVSYLTNGINWKADYVLVVDAKDVLADLSGWVTVNNQSGATYKNAKLKLIAGEVNRVVEPTRRSRGGMEKAMMLAVADSGAGFEEQSFFEYHIYDLQRPTTIKDKQQKQISLLEANDAQVKKEFITTAENYYFYSRLSDKQKQSVQVFIKFKNAKENNLGMPLPAGIIRLYKKDTKDALQFIGEDRIVHTPKDEEIKIKVGEAFDVVVERVQTDFKQITTRMVESEWEITLRNHKEEDVVIGVVEPMTNGNWSVISKSHDFIKENAFIIRFNVSVAKNDEVKVKYRVQTGM